jgi:hypothetical protein
MLPLYATPFEDLGQGDFVKVDCAGIVNLSRGGILLPWVARGGPVQRSPWHAYRAAPLKRKGPRRSTRPSLS